MFWPWLRGSSVARRRLVRKSSQSPRRETRRDELLRRARGAPEDAPAEGLPSAVRRAEPREVRAAQPFVRGPQRAGCAILGAGARHPAAPVAPRARAHHPCREVAAQAARPRVQRDVEEAAQRLRAPAAAQPAAGRDQPSVRQGAGGRAAAQSASGREGALPRRRVRGSDTDRGAGGSRRERHRAESTSESDTGENDTCADVFVRESG